jgi:hypothetical protein
LLQTNAACLPACLPTLQHNNTNLDAVLGACGHAYVLDFWVALHDQEQALQVGNCASPL